MPDMHCIRSKSGSVICEWRCSAVTLAAMLSSLTILHNRNSLHLLSTLLCITTASNDSTSSGATCHEAAGTVVEPLVGDTCCVDFLVVVQ